MLDEEEMFLPYETIDEKVLNKEEKTLMNILNAYCHNFDNELLEIYEANVFYLLEDPNLSKHIKFSEIEEIIEAKYDEYMLIFEIELKNNDSNILQISYGIEGKEEYNDYEDIFLYYYRYSFANLQQWNNYGDVIINIRTNEDYPYVIHSNYEFEKKEDENGLKKIPKIENQLI